MLDYWVALDDYDFGRFLLMIGGEAALTAFDLFGGRGIERIKEIQFAIANKAGEKLHIQFPVL
jgi:hypothetical protein